jgi:CRP-like cAMP-binding protein
MPVTVEQLKNVPLLAKLDKKSLNMVAGQMRERRLPSGAEIVVQGENGVGFFVLLEGEAEVTIDGKPRRTLRAGDHFGEVALISRDPVRSATVAASTDVQVAGLASWQFRPLVLEHPDLAWTLLESMATQMSQPQG